MTGGSRAFIPGTSAPSRQPSTTTPTDTVARHAASLRSAIGWAWSRCTAKQDNPSATNLYRDAVTRDELRSKCLEQVCTLVIDIARRGTLEDAESIPLHLSAIARAEWASANPDGTQVELSVAEAHIAEEIAEGACDAAETRMCYDPSLSNRLAYLASLAALKRAQRDLELAVRRQVVLS